MEKTTRKFGVHGSIPDGGKNWNVMCYLNASIKREHQYTSEFDVNFDSCWIAHDPVLKFYHPVMRLPVN